MNTKSIQELSQIVFGTIPLQINRKTIGICNEVFELTYDPHSYILRINEHKEWIYGTHKFLPIFQNLQIQTPQIIAEDYSKSSFPFCYQIQTKLEGQDLVVVFPELSTDSLKSIAKEISGIYDKFNALPDQDTFGGMTGLREEKETSLFHIINQKRAAAIEQNQISQVLDQKVVSIYDQLIQDYADHFKAVRPKLYFDDMSSKNVMIHQGQFNGLVDLDFLMKGDFLQGIGGIIADWYGSEAGAIYIAEIVKNQQLNDRQKEITKVYAIMHLIGWTLEEGVQFNRNTTADINWAIVAQKRRKIIDLYNSI